MLWPGDAATVSEDATPDAELVKLHFTTSDKHIHWLQVPQGVLARWLGPPLPLHTAIVTEDNPVVARALLAASPRSASLAVDGRLPLHLALELRRSAATVAALICAHPEGAQVAFPKCDVHCLHAAIRLRHPLRVVRALLRAWPGAARAPDAAGELPLHAALRCDAPDAVVIAVLRAHPAAAAAPCPFLLSVPVSVGGLRGCFRNHFNLPTEQWDAKQLRERPDNQW